MKIGKFQIYTGKGKGKTTAALGLCFRALGQDLKVKIFQLRKSKVCGEHIQAKRIGLDISQCPVGRSGEPCASPCPLIIEAMEMFEKDAPDILVIDEMMEAIRVKCVSIDEAVELVKAKPEGTELIMTGRNVPQELLDLADLITSMEPIKHYYKDGVPAREGIEY